MSKTYKKCDEDFKKTLVALYESGKRISDLEREYGINESTIRAWVKKYGPIITRGIGINLNTVVLKNREKMCLKT